VYLFVISSEPVRCFVDTTAKRTSRAIYSVCIVYPSKYLKKKKHCYHAGNSDGHVLLFQKQTLLVNGGYSKRSLPREEISTRPPSLRSVFINRIRDVRAFRSISNGLGSVHTTRASYYCSFYTLLA